MSLPFPDGCGLGAPGHGAAQSCPGLAGTWATLLSPGAPRGEGRRCATLQAAGSLTLPPPTPAAPALSGDPHSPFPHLPATLSPLSHWLNVKPSKSADGLFPWDAVTWSGIRDPRAWVSRVEDEAAVPSSLKSLKLTRQVAQAGEWITQTGCSRAVLGREGGRGTPGAPLWGPSSRRWLFSCGQRDSRVLPRRQTPPPSSDTILENTQAGSSEGAYPANLGRLPGVSLSPSGS